MKGKLLAFLLALFGVATLGVVQLDANAAVDNSRDCDRFAVVYCGTMSVAEARNKYDQRDHAKIFSAMGISKSELGGNIRDGVVYQNGTVKVGGKVVATGAMMAARGLGGSPISGTGASKVSVSRMGSAQTAFVKFDSNGRFEFAVMKPCGNPVTAQPPKPEPQPAALCKNLAITKIERTKFRFDARAEVKNGATVRSYQFVVSRGTQQVAKQTVTTSKLNASYTYTAERPGTYTVRVTVNTSVGPKSGPTCVKQFTVAQPPEQPKNPGVDIEKFVENVKYKRVGINVEYEYQINVINTGDIDLKNVVVTDTPDQGITLISASAGEVEDNTWTYTIPELKVEETMEFTLKAKVPAYLAGLLTNTVCVDAPEVPGNPDDCDKADVDVPKQPGKIEVCELATNTVITIDEDEYNPQLHSFDLSDCDEAPVTELPKTGPAETALQLMGAMSLAGSGAYYLTSRRNNVS
jgi:uncharacterized repeat protein (TIGR01451 family)/LPXTG-motif cell wall-anchored protein